MSSKGDRHAISWTMYRPPFPCGCLRTFWAYPIATLTGFPPAGGGFCGLFGTTKLFDDAKLAELQADRAKLSAEGISPEHIRLYTDLLATREGEALALLVDQVCQGCYVSIPKNLAVRLLRGSELVQCPSCGRILYLPDDN